MTTYACFLDVYCIYTYIFIIFACINYINMSCSHHNLTDQKCTVWGRVGQGQGIEGGEKKWGKDSGMLNWQYDVCFSGEMDGWLKVWQTIKTSPAHLEKHLLKSLSLEAQTWFDLLNYFVSLDSFSESGHESMLQRSDSLIHFRKQVNRTIN